MPGPCRAWSGNLAVGSNDYPLPTCVGPFSTVACAGTRTHRRPVSGCSSGTHPKAPAAEKPLMWGMDCSLLGCVPVSGTSKRGSTLPARKAPRTHPPTSTYRASTMETRALAAAAAGIKSWKGDYRVRPARATKCAHPSPSQVAGLKSPILPGLACA